MISHGELIGIVVRLVTSKGGKVIVGLQSECDVAYFREVKNRPFARSRPDTRFENAVLPCIHQILDLPEAFSPLGERVHSELINSSKLLGDKYVFLCRATHSVLRTTANSVQYVESTPANQTMGSCASLVITKESSSTSAMGQIRHRHRRA